MSRIGDGLTFSYADFSPGELAQMTGLPQELQRVWRRRGQIAQTAGATARFNSLMVAELYVRHELSLWGCSPKEAATIGSQVAPTVVYFALLNGDGACQITATLAQAEKFVADFADGDRLSLALSGCEDDSRFICATSFKEFRRIGDIVPIIAEEARTSMLVIDLQVLGSTLANRAPRALVNVAGPSLAAERTVRKLTSAL